MDHEDGDKEYTDSILQGIVLNKALRRDFSIGHSSRVYYRSTEKQGVPFKWEMQPGTPKNPPREEVIPPPTPPPSVQSLGFPKPNIVDVTEPTPSRLWFWKRIKIRRGNGKKVERVCNEAGSIDEKRRGNDEKVERGCNEAGSIDEKKGDDDKKVERGGCNEAGSTNSCALIDSEADSSGDFAEWFNDSRSSPVSSSSFPNGLLEQPRLRRDMPFSCNPWNMREILVYIARRI